MAAQLPPQLSVPFSLFLLGFFFDPSFSFLSFSFFFVVVTFLFHHYLPAHERLAVPTRSQKDVAELHGNGCAGKD
jgi:hypothetical protein